MCFQTLISNGILQYRAMEALQSKERKANGRNPRFVKLRGLNPDRPVVCISTLYRFVSKVATERERRRRGHQETIGERFERDLAVMLPLPAAPYEACEKISASVSSLSLVRYRTNDYSVRPSTDTARYG